MTNAFRTYEVPRELGGHGGGVVDGDEPAVGGEELLAHGGGAVDDAAGGLVDVLAADALGEALGTVPAAQDASGADAVVGRYLADSQECAGTSHRWHAAV